MRVLLCICAVLAFATGQRITTIQLDGVQYFVSRMNPYSPELNYFLAYQYCRSLGLQLASFETKEKVESMTEYLKNAGYSRYDFWTSGNRLGTGMFLWMSTGLPFNATFDYFENSNMNPMADLDPMDHNANTAPQRTARDSSSGLEKGCVTLKAPNLMWAPEDCGAVKDFICEQTRCYYYNYGSIPVSSAQGRPITTTTPAPFGRFASSTTPSTPIAMTLNLNAEQQAPLVAARKKNLNHDEDTMEMIKATKVQLKTDMEESEELPKPMSTHEPEAGTTLTANDDNTEAETETEADAAAEEEEPTAASELEATPAVEATASVEQRLKQITEEVGKIAAEAAQPAAPEVGRQSFMSLSDLIRNLRPNDKANPQIDSDYSNTMRVLGEPGAVIVESSRKVRNSQQVY